MTHTKDEALKLMIDALKASKHGDLDNKWADEAIVAGEQALAAPTVQEPVACFIGAKGSAFDLPETKRAYTYKEQPGNAVASKLGRACDASSKQRAGDNIDRGLGLLQELQKEGFGVFALGAEYTTLPAAPTVQEPVDSMGMPLSCGKPLCSPGDHHPLCKLATPPAALVQCEWCNGRGVLAGHAQDGSFDGEDCPHCAPPAAQRQWVGLTDAELSDAYVLGGLRLVQEKIKVKNNG